jgi:glycosyltransferase involved in cell wall biosynthesis
MRRIFLFGASTGISHYGVGNYTDLIFKVLHKEPLITIVYIDFKLTSDKENIELTEYRNRDIKICFKLNSGNLYKHFDSRRVISAMEQLFEMKANDFFHFNCPEHLSIIQTLRDRLNPSILYTIHFDIKQLEKMSDLNYNAELKILELCSTIICLNDEAISTIERINPVYRKKTIRINTPLPTIPHASLDQLKKIRLEYGISERDTIILYNGRIDKNKGIYDFFKIFPSILRTNPNTILLIIGDGNLNNALYCCRKFIGNVRFTGYISREDRSYKYRLLQLADLAILPSYSEQLSMTFLEMAALEIPILVHNIAVFKIYSHITTIALRNGTMDKDAFTSKVVEVIAHKEEYLSKAKLLKKELSKTNSIIGFKKKLLTI